MLTVSSARADTYYVDDGRTISRVDSGSFTDIAPDVWQERLYRRGQATEGSENWGLIEGKSAQSVVTQLRDAQDFEKRYERWCACGEDSFTYFNALGPIAVFKSTPQNDLLNVVLPIVARLNKLRKLFDQISDIVAEKSKNNNQFARVGEALKEYSENLKDIQKRISVFQNILARLDLPQQQIADGFRDVTNDLERGEKQYPQLDVALFIAAFHESGAAAADSTGHFRAGTIDYDWLFSGNFLSMHESNGVIWKMDLTQLSSIDEDRKWYSPDGSPVPYGAAPMWVVGFRCFDGSNCVRLLNDDGTLNGSPVSSQTLQFFKEDEAKKFIARIQDQVSELK